MANDECRMIESLQASSRGTAALRPDTSLNQFKIDRSAKKSSRQAEYLKSKIRIPKSKICFWKFLSLIRLAAFFGQRPYLYATLTLCRQFKVVPIVLVLVLVLVLESRAAAPRTNKSTRTKHRTS
ncbi:hypothetical protein D1AOALGA4SA_6337 [Olavius algarvensis Delta 1 endosymbiont]|nr:hypothetical protein D1AOALGA4SA_6337 [Olavius algarvensis Delta 1 endosymbiont]